MTILVVGIPSRTNERCERYRYPFLRGAPRWPPLADASHQLCIGSCLGPHVLVLGQVYENAEDAGGYIEGEGKAGTLLGPLGELGGGAWRGSSLAEHGVELWGKQPDQHAAAVHDVDRQCVRLHALIRTGTG